MPIRVILIRLIIPRILIIRTPPIIIRTTPITRTTLLISAQFHFTIVTLPADFRDTIRMQEQDFGMAGTVETSCAPALVFMVQSGLGIMGERRQGTGDPRMGV